MKKRCKKCNIKKVLEPLIKMGWIKPPFKKPRNKTDKIWQKIKKKIK